MLQTNRDLNTEYDMVYQEWAAAGFPDRDGNPVTHSAAELEAVVTPWYLGVKR